MGDKILKKEALLIALSCLVMANEKSVDLSWVDQEIAAIKPPREGVSNRTISLLKDPFVFLHKNKETQEKKENRAKQPAPALIPSVTNSCSVTAKSASQTKSLKLKAIINNAALINDRWYKVGQTVGHYKIVKVTLNEVTLQSANKTMKLTTYTNKLKK